MPSYKANPKLICTNDELKLKFNSLKTFIDVADLLEISPEHLHYILFKKNKSELYYEFKIPKKGKGTRKILAPCKSLKILQEKLNYIISLIYKPKFIVHGFVQDRSIVTNAKQHLNKRFVLNFDLENFFPSINFGRIRGVFMSFFGIMPDAATTLANICCFQNALPQGAPTSPILSNMVCFKLDKELQTLAKQHSCVYTRYADDITFSTTKGFFPKAIALKTGSEILLGSRIKGILNNNGFIINERKTRLVNKNERLEVTGIIVNEKLNIERNYIKKIRAMLRCLETNDLDTAQEIFKTKYHKTYKKAGSNTSILNVVYGMINYVKMVRGKEDEIFGRLARRYNDIIGLEVFNIMRNPSELRNLYTWVIEVGIQLEDEFVPDQQGTGFFLKGIGFVTNAHVISKIKSNECDSIIIHRSRYSQEIKTATISKYDAEQDLAILKIDDIPDDFGFDFCLENEIGDEITVLGYPDHNVRDSLYVDQGHIRQYRDHYMPTYNPETQMLGKMQERMIVSARIVVGNSGGPVVNSQNQVVGVATKGFTTLSEDNKIYEDTTVNAVVQIKDVLNLISSRQETTM